MDFGKEAHDIANLIRRSAARRLRRRYPWLKTKALERMVDKTCADIKAALMQEQEVMDASRSRMGFMKLPPELRNRIYELALTSSSEDEPKIVVIKSYLKPPSLLQVSRQIQAEATPIYYSQNIFRVSIDFSPGDGNHPWSIEMLQRWLTSLEEKRRSRIQKIVVDISMTDDIELYDTCCFEGDPTGSKLMVKGDTREWPITDCAIVIDRCGIPFEKWELKWQYDGYDYFED